MKHVALLCVCLFVGGAMLVGTDPVSFSNIAQHPAPICPAAQAGYDMVVIAPEDFVDALEPLVDHKSRYGCTTLLETIESITISFDGRDDAEKLKHFLKDAVERHGVSYALLVGGRKPLSNGWYVPVRYSRAADNTQYSEFLSDLYFADLYDAQGTFEDWDSNRNGLFGEFSLTGKDVIDLVPDLAVGRLPCRTLREVNIVVEKIITYETTAFGTDWSTRMVAVGGNTFPQADAGPFPYEGEATCDVACGFMDGYDITKLYTSDGSLTGPQDIIESINRGCGFLMTRGRGGTDRIRMVTAEGEEFVAFRNCQVTQLHNDGQYPIMVLGECIHGKFDVGIFNLLSGFNLQDCVPECIGWRLIRRAGGGAIATVTNTNICYGTMGDSDGNGIPDDAEQYGGSLTVDFFRQLATGQYSRLGDLYRATVTNYVETFPVMENSVICKSVEEWLLLGDPSLQVGGYP
jgi:hypothetical protein